MREIQQLKAEMMMINGWHDKWGEAVNWHFSICDALQLRDDEIPESWQYKAGIFGVDDENFDLEILSHFKTETLVKMGDILRRYIILCEKAGLSY